MEMLLTYYFRSCFLSDEDLCTQSEKERERTSDSLLSTSSGQKRVEDRKAFLLVRRVGDRKTFDLQKRRKHLLKERVTIFWTKWIHE